MTQTRKAGDLAAEVEGKCKNAQADKMPGSPRPAPTPADLALAELRGRLSSILHNSPHTVDHILPPATAHPLSKMDFPVPFHNQLRLE